MKRGIAVGLTSLVLIPAISRHAPIFREQHPDLKGRAGAEPHLITTMLSRLQIFPVHPSNPHKPSTS